MLGLLTRQIEFCKWLMIVPFVALTAEGQCHGAEPTVVREFLSPEEWSRLDVSTDKALNFLASKQLENGSFQALATGQPGITGLCMLGVSFSRACAGGRNTWREAEPSDRFCAGNSTEGWSSFSFANRGPVLGRTIGIRMPVTVMQSPD